MQSSNAAQNMLTGDFLVIGSQCAHDIVAASGSVVLGIQISKQVFIKMFEQFLKESNALSYIFHKFLYSDEERFYLFHIEPTREIKRIIRSLLSEFNPCERYSAQICGNYLNILFYDIIRNYIQAPADIENRRDDSLIFSAIIEEIYNNFTTVTLQSLSERFHYSTSYLSRLIKEKSGDTLMDILIRIRTERAEDLLANTKMSIGDISEMLGYQSPNHFARQFKQQKGFSPTAYRKQMSKKGKKEKKE